MKWACGIFGIPLVSCAPADLGSEVARSGPSTFTRARVSSDTCVKINESDSCDSPLSPETACSLSIGTQIVIENLTGPEGFTFSSRGGQILYAQSISLAEDPSAARNQPATPAGDQTRRPLAAVLAEISGDRRRIEEPQEPAAGSTRTGGRLANCTDSLLEKLAARGQQLAGDSVLKKVPLKVWSESIVPLDDSRLKTLEYGRFFVNFPTRGVISSPFGWRWGRMHHGIDIANSVGIPIVSAQDGRVSLRLSPDESGGYGYAVEVSHFGGKYKTFYAHMPALSVPVGAIVSMGYQIGTIGQTGHSRGPHLHWEVCDVSCWGGAKKTTDPLSHIRGDNKDWIGNIASYWNKIVQLSAEARAWAQRVIGGWQSNNPGSTENVDDIIAADPHLRKPLGEETGSTSM